jgi:hypothetical protein
MVQSMSDVSDASDERGKEWYRVSRA